MGYAIFTNLLASTKFPAHSVDCDRRSSATFARGSLVGFRIRCRPGFGLFRSHPLPPVDPAVVDPAVPGGPGQVPLFQKGVLQRLLMRLRPSHLPPTDLFLSKSPIP
jgi:hypothetical protein